MHFTKAAAPVFRVETCFYIAMKCGIRPVKNSFDVVMFYRLVINLVHVLADLEFPKPPPPHADARR